MPTAFVIVSTPPPPPAFPGLWNILRIGEVAAPAAAAPSFPPCRCQFELGNTAMMVHYLTDPGVASDRLLGADWSVAGLLAEVAGSDNPPFHALIDGGALVTGMTNLEVARCV